MSSIETSCVCRGSFVCVRLPIKRRWNTINRGTLLTNIADVPREKSRFIPDIPKINKHVRSFRAVCRCWPNIGPSLPMPEDVPERVTLFTDVPSLFADALTKPADLAIGDHRAPQSGQCKPGFNKKSPTRHAGSPRINTVPLRIFPEPTRSLHRPSRTARIKASSRTVTDDPGNFKHFKTGVVSRTMPDHAGPSRTVTDNPGPNTDLTPDRPNFSPGRSGTFRDVGVTVV